MVNTPFGRTTRSDGYALRTEAVKHGVTCVTALSGASAFVAALEAAADAPDGFSIRALQDLEVYDVTVRR